MHAAEKFEFSGQTLWLSTNRCIYWEDEKALILSDTHFGKTGHFRKHGIGVPQEVYHEDLFRLIDMVQYFAPTRMVVVGDMFHSHSNKEMDLFLRRRNDISQVNIQLVMGNHDILLNEFYNEAKIATIDQLDLGPYSFVHDINDIRDSQYDNGQYYFSGHMHPGILLKGLGRQSLKFSCFYFGKQFAILPAFGKFNGTSAIIKSKGDTVFAIMPCDAQKNQPGKVFRV